MKSNAGSMMLKVYCDTFYVALHLLRTLLSSYHESLFITEAKRSALKAIVDLLPSCLIAIGKENANQDMSHFGYG
jgi:hypothetical protein